MGVGKIFEVFPEEMVILSGASESYVCFSFRKAFLKLMEHPGFDLIHGCHYGTIYILILLTVLV